MASRMRPVEPSPHSDLGETGEPVPKRRWIDRGVSRRGRRLALLAGLGVGLVLVVAGIRWRSVRDWWRFQGAFEQKGIDAEGLAVYRDRRTGIHLVDAQDAARVRFSGSVARGERYAQEISKVLRFELRPGGSGWTVELRDPRREDEELSHLVTPPYHGINDRYVEGFHFRNSDNTGPNAPGPKNVNAPGRRREFLFALDGEDYLVARDTLDRILYDGNYPPGEADRAWKRREAMELGEGRLEIRTLELGNLVAGESASIESMSFDVELRIPWSRFQEVFFP